MHYFTSTLHYKYSALHYKYSAVQVYCTTLQVQYSTSTVQGKTIPRHCAVSAAVWVLHHDEAFWTEPWKFDPERFAPENRDKIVEMTYMPFGEGPRNCIGRRFALMEAKMALVEVLRRFRLETCHKTPETIRVRNKGLTLSVIGDELWLKISKR